MLGLGGQAGEVDKYLVRISYEGCDPMRLGSIR